MQRTSSEKSPTGRLSYLLLVRSDPNPGLRFLSNAMSYLVFPVCEGLVLPSLSAGKEGFQGRDF